MGESTSADVFLGVISGGAAGYAVAKWLEREKEKRDKKNKKMVAKITRKEQKQTAASAYSSDTGVRPPPLYQAPVGLNVDYGQPNSYPQHYHEGATAHVQRYLKELPQRFHAAEAAWHKPWGPVQHPGEHSGVQPAYDQWGNLIQPQQMYRSSSRPVRPQSAPPGHHPPHLRCGSSPLCSYNEGFR